jgi:hypothetical protein
MITDIRAKLSAALLEALEADFAENGVAAIKLLRERSPEKYCELSARLIAATEPPGEGFDSAQSMEEVGRKLLESIGLAPDIATAEMIQAAIQAHDELVRRLGQIAAGH